MDAILFCRKQYVMFNVMPNLYMELFFHPLNLFFAVSVHSTNFSPIISTKIICSFPFISVNKTTSLRRPSQPLCVCILWWYYDMWAVKPSFYLSQLLVNYVDSSCQQHANLHCKLFHSTACPKECILDEVVLLPKTCTQGIVGFIP